MNAQPRLHLVSGVKVDDHFDNLFHTVEAQAGRVIDAFTALDADAAWDLAQYVDLVDAGHTASSPALYRRAMTCLSNFVATRMHRPLSRALFGRSAVLSRMVERQLDDSAQALTAAEQVVLAA